MSKVYHFILLHLAQGTISNETNWVNVCSKKGKENQYLTVFISGRQWKCIYLPGSVRNLTVYFPGKN